MPTLNIKFQTNELTPPPYAYAIEIETKPFSNGLQASFEINYLEREVLTIDEIIDEGFTENDDFKLRVNLPNAWLDALDAIYSKSTFHKKETLEDHEEYFEISGQFPENTEEWKLFLEQMQQAILEKAEREAPLFIEIIRINHDGKNVYEFNASFVDRTFTVTKNKEPKSLTWKQLNSFLEDIFVAEIKYEKAKTESPQKEGIYLQFGDGMWLELGNSYLTQPSKIKAWL
jgi:hypothetical protein